ncbi:MAG: GDP-mannose 4,6-dehydratase [Gemmatimonadaceae bacterium]
MSRRVLITGGSGFVGQWLTRALMKRGDTVFAGTLEGPPRVGVLDAQVIAATHWLTLDTASDASIRAAVTGSAPDWIVHLAGIAYPPDANADPVRAFEVNALGALRLLTAVATSARDARVLIIGSADEYGPYPPDRYPLDETTPLAPRSVYGSSKAAQELLALQMWRSAGLQVVCTRSFNHSGAGHADTYLLPALVRRAAALPETGGTLLIGNAAPVRDYLHVADVVDAYLLLLDRGTAGEVYNVCSGKGVSVRQLAEHVLRRLGVRAAISTDPALSRPSDTPVLIGDNSRLRGATGWSPRRSIDDIIDDLSHATTR